MVAGRKPKPTELKKLEGNPGHRPLPSNEPRYDEAGDRAPTGMSNEGRKYWHAIARQVIESGVLRTVDVPAFVLMAEHYGLAMRAVKAIEDRERLTVIDENGNERKVPLLQVFRDNAAAYRAFASEFGMTPASRPKVHGQADGEQLSLADELFGMVTAAQALAQEKKDQHD